MTSSLLSPASGSLTLNSKSTSALRHINLPVTTAAPSPQPMQPQIPPSTDAPFKTLASTQGLLPAVPGSVTAGVLAQSASAVTITVTATMTQTGVHPGSSDPPSPATTTVEILGLLNVSFCNRGGKSHLGVSPVGGFSLCFVDVYHWIYSPSNTVAGFQVFTDFLGSAEAPSSGRPTTSLQTAASLTSIAPTLGTVAPTSTAAKTNRAAGGAGPTADSGFE